jgi:hypothetical protein
VKDADERQNMVEQFNSSSQQELFAMLLTTQVECCMA